MIAIIARHEIFVLFKTGKIWKLLALSQLFLGLIFYWLMQDFIENDRQSMLGNTSSFGITEKVIHPLFAWTTLFFFFITPLLATNSITQERKTQALDLYLTSPICPRDIILGKFLGGFSLQLFLLLPTLTMPLIILYQDHLDLGQLFSSILGLLLIQGATLSLAFYIASLCKESITATLFILITFFLLSLIEWVARFFTIDIRWISELGLLYHCKNFLSGIVSSKDIAYYSAILIVSLYFTIQRLEQEPISKRIL